MPSTIQRSMAGGELAPALYARADQAKYAIGLKTVRNFEIMRHGGATNRPGMRYIATAKTLGKRVRLVRFVFNADQTYVLEVGENYIRFIRNGAQIVVSGVAAYNGATTYAQGDLVSYAGVNYYSKQSGSLAHQPDISPTWWYALSGVIFEVPTTYAEAEVSALVLHYVQSGDVITIVHPNHKPAELRRTGHTAWTLVDVAFASSQGAPTAPGLALGGAGTGTYQYCVTAIASESYEESVASAVVQSAAGAVPTEQAAHVINWTAPTGPVPQQYIVYKAYGGLAFGFCGVASASPFRDTGIVPDFSRSPPVARNPFNAAGDYPSTVSYAQQRRCFADTDNAPEDVFMSRTGLFSNFTISYPLQDDDAVTFTIAGDQVNAVRHLAEVDSRLIVLTSGAEWTMDGDTSGAITPNDQNPRRLGGNGASTLAPVVVGSSLLYVQARGSIVRDLRYEVSTTDGSAGYRGRDLTVYASHLFDGYQIVDWAYAPVPQSIVWAVREDGVLLGLTYLREQEIWGWHHHDTDGLFENIVSVPEGNEDTVYAVVLRTIGGVEYRYIEQFASRQIKVLKTDAFFVDSGLSYDGRNTGATTMKLTGGVTWDVTELLTCESSVAYFVVGDVGNEIRLRIPGDEIRFLITGYTNNQHVTGYASKNVPAGLQAVAVTDWGKAVDQVSGAGHLEGKTVSILGDGVVDPQKVITAGAATLSRPYEIIHLGLPITADLETLSIENPQGATLADRKKLINRVTLQLQESAAFYAGPDENHLQEKDRAVTDYNNPQLLEFSTEEIITNSTWDDNGRVLIRQVDPLPLTVLAIVPSGYVS